MAIRVIATTRMIGKGCRTTRVIRGHRNQRTGTGARRRSPAGSSILDSESGGQPAEWRLLPGPNLTRSQAWSGPGSRRHSDFRVTRRRGILERSRALAAAATRTSESLGPD